jgi:hypothetical protein
VLAAVTLANPRRQSSRSHPTIYVRTPYVASGFRHHGGVVTPTLVLAGAFDGVLDPEPGGLLRPDRSLPGLGLQVEDADLEQYRVA